MHLFEFMELIGSRRKRAKKKKGGKKTERNYRKLLKTSVEKMSLFRLSTMLMKQKVLYKFFHDVDEKEGTYSDLREKAC